MVNIGQENEEVMRHFVSGKMSEEERLEILDEKGTAELVRKYLESSEVFPVDKELPKDIESTDIEKIEDLIKQGEVEFAIDLIKGLGENISDYEKFLEGGRIDQNGRPWPSTFCTAINEVSNWNWEEREFKLYETFGKLVENCPQNVICKGSRLGHTDILNLSEKGAEGFYSAISSFPLLRNLTIKKSLENLSSKCPNLSYIDFRRFNGTIDLGILSGCQKLARINLMYSDLVNMGTLPELPNLRNIDLSRCWHLEELETMPVTSSLEVLDLHDCVKLKTLGNLSRFPNLYKLNLTGCKNVELPEGFDKLDISDLTLPEDSEGN